MTDTTEVTIEEVHAASWALARRWQTDVPHAVAGVPRGGLVPAGIVATVLQVPLVDPHDVGLRDVDERRDHPRALNPDCVLVVDDLVDSGRTMQAFVDRGFNVDALYRKPHSPKTLAPHADERNGWLVFPWELGETGPEDAVVRLLEYVGEDPARDGLADTPSRVVRSLAELTGGYAVDVAALFRTFAEPCDEMIVVRGIEFTSLCEHHLLPFTGTATVAYIAADRVVGLSKLARVVDAYARRLQVQERLTAQIAQAIDAFLQPIGVGVVVTARHSCMGCRGVRQPTAEMVTSAVLGAIRDKPAARAEFLAAARA